MSLLTADLYAAPEDLSLTRDQHARLSAATSASLNASALHRSHLQAGPEYVLADGSSGSSSTLGSSKPSATCLLGIQTPPASSTASSRRSSMDPSYAIPTIQEEGSDMSVTRRTSVKKTVANAANWRERLVDLILDRYAQCARKIPASVTERIFFKRCCDALQRLDGVANAKDVAETALAASYAVVMERRAAWQAVMGAPTVQEEQGLPANVKERQRLEREREAQETTWALQRAEYDLAVAKIVHHTYVKRLQA
ncbi:hypothetical protein BCR37DRAFT_395114 [Protomyces lactucae-debilis]|uniref:Uncharacterized protein n=1 Tax=Protomyces lactucae-debilis TaxID=2754530 RepID=A0A1Y2EZM9_PROLT|nr:uncharacterized protein BCR37DRAFT_395114 [Protomyces lactucae-debilis]ORY77033.1 hypothetical protein BCR37DRAFT_395114 [Protomyces lactucae-debilis]